MRDALRRYAPGMKALKVVSLLLVVLTGIWAMPWVFPLINRTVLLTQRGEFREATLVVSRVEYHPAMPDRMATWWAVGIVDDGTGRFPDERMSLVGIIDDPQERSALERRIAPGMTYDVLYNPELPEISSQGESLRVVHRGGDFWTDQWRTLAVILLVGVGPFAASLVLAVAVRVGGRLRRPARA